MLWHGYTTDRWVGRWLGANQCDLDRSFWNISLHLLWCLPSLAWFTDFIWICHQLSNINMQIFYVTQISKVFVFLFFFRLSWSTLHWLLLFLFYAISCNGVYYNRQTYYLPHLPHFKRSTTILDTLTHFKLCQCTYFHVGMSGRKLPKSLLVDFG